MQLTEARVFEMVGRLHAENRELSVENDATKARNDLLVAEIRRLTLDNDRLRAELDTPPAESPTPLVVPDKKKK